MSIYDSEPLEELKEIKEMLKALGEDSLEDALTPFPDLVPNPNPASPPIEESLAEPEPEEAAAEDDSGEPEQETNAPEECSKAWLEEFNFCVRNGLTPHKAKEKADGVFRDTMPNLTDEQNILDFIACVTRGMLIGVLNAREAHRLLYAARVASQSLAAARRSWKANAAEQKPSAEAAA